ncbi:MAG: hypothetical protein RIR52_890 [Acidobacteriota bacterium]
MGGGTIERSLRSLPPVYGCLFLLIIASIAGRIVHPPPVADPPCRSIADNPVVRSFAQAIGVIQKQYSKPPEWEALTGVAITRMLHSLDPHSSFYDRSHFTEMLNEQDSRYYGIGAIINQRRQGVYVLGVIPGTPAERAGMRYGDKIVAIDGTLTDMWSQNKVLANVRGAAGTEVQITVERVGLPRRQTYTIERDEVPYPSVLNHFMIRPGMGYVDLTGGFSQQTTNELSAAINELKSQGMDRLLIDLRQNPGGLLKQAIQASELFLPTGSVIVSVVGREGRTVRRSYVSENQAPETLPLALLIDEGTASAAEILAGALQDNGRACLVGEESFGKGLVQTIFRLRDGTGLSLTTARYLTPSGRSIHRSMAVGGLYDYGRSRKLKGPFPDHPSEAGVGGINPDLPDRPGKTDVSEDERLRLRDASFEFVRLASAGLIPGLEDWRVRRTEAVQRSRRTEYAVNPLVRRLFLDFVRRHPEWLISEPLSESARHYVDRRIRAEMISAAYGPESADQYLLDEDPQVLRALDWLKRRPLP